MNRVAAMHSATTALRLTLMSTMMMVMPADATASGKAASNAPRPIDVAEVCDELGRLEAFL
jgi:hypothetical protein